MRNVSRLAGPLLGVFCLLSSSSAVAGEADAKKAEAAQRFDRGLELFEDGDNAGALAEFKRTYELFPNPVVLYNIGLVYAAMRRPVDAVDALEKVVTAESLSAEQRDRAKLTLADQKARIGRLNVTTTPEGARIEIDNVEVAKTPITAPIRVAEGSHVVGAVADGYTPARKELLIAGNSDATVHLDLVSSEGKKLANLTVKTKLPGVEIRVDGEPAGKTPLASSLTLVAGHHKVEARRPGYTAVTREVDVGAGATGEIAFDMAVDQTQLGAEGATLVVESSESSPVVFVDDESKGPYKAPIRLPKGPHRLRIERGGFLPFEREVALEPGNPNVVRVELEPTPEYRTSYEGSANLHRTWGWIGIISGAVIAGGGAAYLTLVKGPKDDLDAAGKALDQVIHEKDTMASGADAPLTKGECDTRGGGDPSTCNSLIAAYQSDYNDALSKKNAHDVLGFVGIGVGAALAVTGVILLVTGDDPNKYNHEASHQLGQRERGPSFGFVPGPGQFGLGLGAVF